MKGIIHKEKENVTQKQKKNIDGKKPGFYMLVKSVNCRQ